MTCRRCQRSVSAYIDRELNADEMREMQHHLERCPGCQKEYQSILETKRLLSGLASKMPRAELEARILARLDDAAGHRATPRRPVALAHNPLLGRSRMAMVGTALLGACAALILLAMQPQASEPPGPATLSQWQGKPVAVEPAMPVQDMLFLHESWQRYQAASRAFPGSYIQAQQQVPLPMVRDDLTGRLTAGSTPGR